MSFAVTVTVVTLVALPSLAVIMILYRDRSLYRARLESSERERRIVSTLMRTVDVGTWMYDVRSDRILFVSEGVSAVTGYKSDWLVSRNSWRDLIHPDDLPEFRKLSMTLRTGEPNYSEYRIRHADGGYRWIQMRIIPALGEDGELSRLDGVVIDITARKTLEEALVRSEQRYKSLFEYNNDVICEMDLDGRLVAFNPSAESVGGERLAGLAGKVLSEAGSDFLNRLIGTENLRHMAEHMEQTKKGIPQNYELSTRHENGTVHHWEIKSIPIVVQERVTGAFVICRDVTLSHNMQEALVRSEATYRLIAENMSDLVALIRPSGTIRYASPSYRRVLGRDPAAMPGTSIFDYMAPGDGDEAAFALGEWARAGENRQTRCRIVHADGRILHFDCLGTPVFDPDGRLRHIIVVSRDIGDRMMMEKELNESEERYRRLIELSPQPMATQRHGKFVYANPAWNRLFGAASDTDMVGRDVLDMIPESYVPQVRRRMRQIAEHKFTGSAEYELIRLDGQPIVVEVTGIYDERTESSLHVLFDITERKKMEKALKESEERHRRLVELSPVAIAEWKDEKLTYVNPAGTSLIGAEHYEELIGTSPWDWVHPDDREESKRRIAETIRNGFQPSRELRVIRRDGATVYISVTSIYDRLTGTVELVFEDITERKVVERALMESEELNRKLVELSPVAVALHEDYLFTYVNPAGLALFGASEADDLIGRSIFDTMHPASRERAAKRLKAVYSEGLTSTIVEQTNLRLDGTAIEVEVVAAPIPYQGRMAGLTILRDITERKRAEQDRYYAEQIVRESQERYFRLQASLDRFSHELFGVLKIEELERRFVREVRAVFDTEKVSLIEILKDGRLIVKSGDPQLPEALAERLGESSPALPVCKIIDAPEGHFLKIGDIRGNRCYLCVGEKSGRLTILPKRIWLETIARYVSVLYDNFRVIEDLTQELGQNASRQYAPPWLLRLLFTISENERKRLSQDLHDAALQEQIVWYRLLDRLAADPEVPAALRLQLEAITQGLLDVIYQIRMTCNELRPPLLREEGLVSSLEALFELTQLRTDFAISFDASGFGHALNDDQLVGLYRVVQELLANAAKHSSATRVVFTLGGDGEWIRLRYEDNGVGMLVTGFEDTFNSMGVYGMKQRVRSLDGEIRFCSSEGHGLTIMILIPVCQRQEGTQE